MGECIGEKTRGWNCAEMNTMHRMSPVFYIVKSEDCKWTYQYI